MIKLPQTLAIQDWPIDRLVHYARNPRKNDAAVDRMCSSIREFGFKCPVLARSDGEVVDGHLRLKAARKLGITEVPVILCDEWTPAQVKAFRLMVNRSVTWADWDEELLTLELQELAALDCDLSLTGFDPKELDDLLLFAGDDDQADIAPPLPANPVSRAGDLWLCGKGLHQHRVLCADATDPEAVPMILLDDVIQVFTLPQPAAPANGALLLEFLHLESHPQVKLHFTPPYSSCCRNRTASKLDSGRLRWSHRVKELNVRRCH
jgi:ParB-like nuclease domain